MTAPAPSPVELLVALARLAGVDDLVATAELAAPSGGFDWPRLVAEAQAQKLLPSLWAGARRCGLLEPLPDALRRHFTSPQGERPVPAVLEDAADDTRRRTHDLSAQLVEILERCDALGIEAVPIKGSQLLVQSVWPEPDTRVMVDLDLVAEADAAPRLVDDLVARGWRPTPGPHKPWSHHLRGLRHPDHVGSVEIHTEVISLGWQPALRADALRRRSVATSWRGRTVRVPSCSDAVLVALLHGWLADEHRFRGTVPVRATLDGLRLARAATAGGAAVDWDHVAGGLARIHRSELLARHALVAERWFGVAPPPGVTVGSATRRWYARLEPVTAASGRPTARLRRLPYALDAGRLHRYYGPGNLWRLRARRLAGMSGRSPRVLPS